VKRGGPTSQPLAAEIHIAPAMTAAVMVAGMDLESPISVEPAKAALVPMGCFNPKARRGSAGAVLFGVPQALTTTVSPGAAISAASALSSMRCRFAACANDGSSDSPWRIALTNRS